MRKYTYTIASFFVLLCALFAAFSTTLEPYNKITTSDLPWATVSNVNVHCGPEMSGSHCIKEAESHDTLEAIVAVARSQRHSTLRHVHAHHNGSGRFRLW